MTLERDGSWRDSRLYAILGQKEGGASHSQAAPPLIEGMLALVGAARIDILFPLVGPWSELAVREFTRSA